MTQTQITWGNKGATRKNRYTATCQYPANYFRYSSDGSDTTRRPGETRFGVYVVPRNTIVYLAGGLPV
jgi:hypothetical protein